VLTVSELTARIGEVLEERFPAVWVEGEISNFYLHGSGHAYFTLKDADAQLRAVLFRTRMRRIRFEPTDGLHVLAFGAIEVYRQRGEISLVVELLEPKGLGALQLAFEQLKARLQAEGLFDQARKRELPRFPRRIGIATSPTGAAIQDMLRVIRRRFGELNIVISPCRVQGDGAAEEIARAVRDLNALGDVDVIIVGRGGGSIEDLWAFNQEAVARAIAGSKVPVVSAVGHEVDFTIADFVADLRAPTPSAAAELVVREKQAVVDTLAQLRARLERSAARPLRDMERRVDELTMRLHRGLRSEVSHAGHRVALAARALRAADPVARVRSDRHRLAGLEGRLIASFTRRCDRARSGLRAAVARLDSLSPLAVLGRGYSLTRARTGEFVRSASQVKAGDDVQVLLQQGSLDARVTATREQDDRPQV
jgi:exodeoxyribonuclease VII large subunit